MEEIRARFARYFNAHGPVPTDMYDRYCVDLPLAAPSPFDDKAMNTILQQHAEILAFLASRVLVAVQILSFHVEGDRMTFRLILYPSDTL